MSEIEFSRMRAEFVVRGRTAVAARALHMVVATAAQGVLGDKVYSPLTTDMIERLVKPYAPQIQAKLGISGDDVFALLGIKPPVTQIFARASSGFEAAHRFPDISAISDTQDAYILHAPIGYDGTHFVPQDAQMITASDHIGSGEYPFIRGVGAVASPPVLMCLPTPAPLPADFDAQRHAWSQNPLARPKVAG